LKKLFSISLEEKKFISLCYFFSSFEGSVTLYTGKAEDEDSSYLFLFPTKVSTLQTEKTLASSIKESRNSPTKNPFDHLQEDLNFGEEDFIEWVGFLPYELGGYSDRDKTFKKHSTTLPLYYFQKSAFTIQFKHGKNQATVFFDPLAEAFLTSEEKKWQKKLLDKQFFQDFTQGLKPLNRKKITSSISYRESKRNYLAKIQKIQEEIEEGNVYQANLSHEMVFQMDTSPKDLFFLMLEEHKAPFSALFCLREYQILSLSPERFLKKEGEKLVTMPIKGTIQRGLTKEKDQQYLQALLSSEKDRAELLMITDLLRNDLSKISQIGSVKVDELFAYKGFSNVWHLFSKIQSIALLDKHPIEIIRALFPGGSITGCPKLSAQKIIEELEDRPRGIYTGSIGYFKNNGDFDFNIAIRTLLSQESHHSLGLGGAIVIDSEKEKEYAETYHKGASFFKGLGLQWEDIF